MGIMAANREYFWRRQCNRVFTLGYDCVEVESKRPHDRSGVLRHYSFFFLSVVQGRGAARLVQPSAESHRCSAADPLAAPSKALIGASCVECPGTREQTTRFRGFLLRDQ